VVSAKPGAVLTRFKECLLTGVAHVEANDGPSELMNESHPIPVPLATLAKKNDCAAIDEATCLGRLIPLFWMVLCSCMLLVPFFWVVKFSGVLMEGNEELMIVNSNGDENYSSTVKGEAFVWKEWARWQFQCRGVINLDFLIDWEGSMVWCRRKKKVL
jgi:hypothetical protein